MLSHQGRQWSVAASINSRVGKKNETKPTDGEKRQVSYRLERVGFQHRRWNAEFVWAWNNRWWYLLLSKLPCYSAYAQWRVQLCFNPIQYSEAHQRWAHAATASWLYRIRRVNKDIAEVAAPYFPWGGGEEAQRLPVTPPPPPTPLAVLYPFTMHTYFEVLT